MKNKESLLKRTAKKALPYTGLAALVALQTPIHESVHCATAELTGGNCTGVVLSAQNNWYMKPLEYITFGFYKVGDLAVGIDGVTSIAHADTLFGKLGSIATAALPEFMYTAVGMGLVKLGLENYKKKPLFGMVQTLAGGLCMSSTLNYMRVSLYGARPGHDYYDVTQKVLDILHLPESLASAMTPLVGIPLLFVAAYGTAAIVTNKMKSE